MVTQITLGAPESCFTDLTCEFSVSGSVQTDQIQLVIRNLSTGVSVVFIHSGNLLAGAVFFEVILNSSLVQFPNLLPTVCGSGQGLQVQAFGLLSGAQVGASLDLTTTFVKSPCICTQISNVFTTIDAFPCVSIDGTIGIQGKLFEVTCSGGIPSPLVNLASAVLIGLTDPSTGIFYQYVAASTDNFGTFSVGFGIKDRSEVVALVPDTGSKVFNLEAFFPGSNTLSPSAMFSKTVTVSGAEGTMTCSLGTLVVDQVYATADPTKEQHTIQQGFVGGLVVGGVTLSFENVAIQVRDTVHDAIIKAGAVPIEIKVYQGPTIQVPAFFGFIGVPTASFMVVATAQGSPIAGLVIVAVIIAALIILAFFVFLIFSVVKDILGKPGGAATLIVGGVVLLAGAGIAAYLLTRPRVRRALR